jgi:hypothetical protein
MRWRTAGQRAYSHVVLLSPIGNDRWLLFQWGFDGLFVRPIGFVEATRLFDLATEVLLYDAVERAPHSALNSLLPNTCMTLARQVMGLPARWNFVASGLALRSELLARGAEVVVPKRAGSLA